MPNIRVTPISVNKILHHLNDDEFKIVSSILRNGCLRTAKPKIEYECASHGHVKYKVPGQPSGAIAFLWASVAYELSPYKRDLASPPDHRQYLHNLLLVKRLREIAKLIIDTAPQEYHYGDIARGKL